MTFTTAQQEIFDAYEAAKDANGYAVLKTPAGKSFTRWYQTAFRMVRKVEGLSASASGGRVTIYPTAETRLTELARGYAARQMEDWRRSMFNADKQAEIIKALKSLFRKFPEIKAVALASFAWKPYLGPLTKALEEPKINKACPLYKQYEAAKKVAPEAIALFRMGDFYEVFYQDAEVCSRTLGLTLTTRNKASEAPVPMAGFPYHQLQGYVNKLVASGFRVSVNDPA